MSSCNFNNKPISNQQKGTLQDADTKNAGDVWAAITGTSNTESPGVSTDNSAYLDISESLGFPPINIGGQTAFDTLQSSGIARKLAHFDLLEGLKEAEILAETIFTTDANAVTYTPEQKKAIEKAVNYAKNAFSRGNNKAFLLEGSAGTGKTTIIGGIVEELSTTYGRDLGIVAGAVSSQATGTLFKKIGKKVKKGAVLKSSTVFSMQGKGGENEKGKFQVDIENSILNKDKIKDMEYILLIVDEASMISNDILANFQKIIEKLNEKGRKVAIIYAGDIAQVRPIKGGTKSLLFYENNDFIEDGASLTKIIRQSGESPILDIAIPLSKISKEEINDPIHKFLPEVAKISTQGNLIPMGVLADSILDAFEKGLNMNNPFYIKIVAYTNAKVNEVNSMIADHFFKLQEKNLLYAENMPMLANKNIVLADGRSSLENNEPFIIKADIPNKEIEELKQDSKSRNLVVEEQVFNDNDRKTISELIYTLHSRGLINQPQDLIEKLDTKISLIKVPIVKYNIEGKEVKAELYIITRGEEVKFRNAVTEYYNVISTASKNYLSKSRHWAIYYSKFNKIGNIEEKAGVQDKNSEPPGIAPFFAITAHKSQGATYDISVVLVDNIMSSGNSNKIAKAELLYTAITRAANTVVLIDENIPSYNDNNDINIVEITDNTIENRKSGVAKGVSDLLKQQAEEAKVVEEIVSTNPVEKPITANTSTNIVKENLPGPETKINIYAGNNENADLSNFANRPFTINLLDKDIKVNSVEQAFQLSKLYEAYDELEEDTFNKWEEDILSATPAKAKALGKKIPLSKAALNSWDGKSSEVMGDLIKKSFEQNPQALQKLLDTGNATLTHNQGTGKWRTEFPELLMDVRKELRDFQPDNLEQQSVDINTISNKTASYGVIIDPKLKQHIEQFHNKHPKGIIAYRVNFNTYNTTEEVSKGHIGNPFSEGTKGEDTVQKFYDWLMTGNNFNNTKATEEFRQAIIQRILNTPQNTPILYYTELNRPSHATVIGYLINNKQLLSNTTSTPQANNALSKGISLRKPISASVVVQACKKAIQSTSKDDVTQTVKDLKQGKSLNEFLGTTKKPFFSKEEIENINNAIGKWGKNKNGLFISSLDRQTDGVLFAKEVIRKLEENAKLPIGHPDRIYAMEIWSKHDGKAMFDILDACKKYRVAPMVSFSITSLGGTPFEDGVKDWRDLMKDIEELVKSGVIDTTTTTIRLDPFMPGITDKNELSSIIKESKKLGITRFVSSILNSYANNPERKVMDNIDNAYKKYTGTDEKFPWRDFYDPGKFLPKEEILDEYFSIIKELQEENGVTIKICANGVEGKMKGLSPAACLDPYIIEEVSGVGIIDSEGNYLKEKARPYEHCYGNRGNLLGNKYPCYSRCAFCYAAQGDNDSVLSYYKNNGELNTEDPRVQYLSKIEKLNNKMDRILKNSEIYVEDFLPENVKARFDKEGINYKGKKVESSDTLINIQKGIDVMDAILNHDGYRNNEALKKFGSTALQYIKGVVTNNSKYIQEFNNTFESVDFNESTYNAFTSLKALVQNKSIKNSIKNIKLIEQENGKLASLVMDFNSEDLETAITVVAESFKTRVNSAIKKEIKAITNEIASTNSELEKAKLRKTLKELQSKETRIKAVINRIGVQGILDEVLSHCKGLQVNNKSSQESKDFYGKIINHFDTLTQEAFPKIETLLNVRLVEESIDNSKESDKERPEDNEDYNEDDLLETNNSVTFKARERDSFKYASNSTKELLESINILNSEGKFVFYNNTEIPKKYNGVSLFIDLENEFSHSVVHPSDFAIYDENTGLYSFPLLDKIESKYPWVSELKSKLTKKDMHDTIASMYGDLRKDKIEYITFKKNKLTREVRKIDLNKPDAVNALINEIENNIKSGKTNVFNNDGKLSKNSIEALNKYSKSISSSLPIIEELYDTFINTLQNGLKEIFGLEVQVSKENYSSIAEPFQNIVSIMAKKANGDITSIEDLYKNIDISKHLKKLANFISTDTQVASDVSFYSNGKTYQSFREPCEIVQNLKEIKYHREKFLNKFKGDSFYYNSSIEKFRSYLLNKIFTDKTFEIEYQEMFEFDETSYDKWTPFDIKEILFRQYFSTGTKNAWYRMPIHSDSDFMSFLKLPKLEAYNASTGISDTYMSAMVDLVKQELARMARIENRNKELEKGVKSKIEDIAYYDKRGTDFLFIPELNKYKDEIIKARGTDNLNSIIKTSLKTIFKNKLEASYKQLENDKVLYETFTSILKENKIDATTKTSKIEAFYNYQLNNMLMQSQIIQTFYGDLAFYKNDIEFQKRAKQLIAATRKPFTERPDVKKSDRVIILKDSIVTSRHFNTISKILGNKNKQFTRNNATDAQAFRTLPSYVNIMKGFGFWDSKVDDAVVQRIIEGKVSLEDMNTIYQTIKPFVYGLINKKDVNGEILVPHQHKDSEMVLLAMYEHLDSALNSGSILRGLNKFMIDNNIDVAIFETGVKEGIQGVIDISYSPDRLKELNEKLEKQFVNAKELKEYLDKELLADRVSQEDYNSYFEYIEPTENEVYNALNNAVNSVASNQFIHEIPLEHYGKIQDNPEHLLDTTAIWGTQFNVLSVSDMPQEGFSITLNDGTTKKEYTTKEILNLYNSLRNEKFIEGWNVAKEVFENKQTLQKKLIQLLKTNSNYDYKLKDALELKSMDRLGNIETMDFNTSMNMPNMIDSFSSMMLSVFKKNVVRHEVKGGTATLASSWGFFDKSNSEYKAPEIVFDKNGNLEAVECYLTASSKDFFEAFIEEKKDNDGNSYYVLSVDEMPEDLKMCVGYRIPTENKYSMLPLRIKGFIPVQNGTSIIVPPEITTIAGIDFDIDKTFIVLPMYEKKNKYDWKAINRDFKEKYPELVKAKSDELYDYFWKNYVRELKEANINTKEVRKNDKERFAAYVKKAKELYNREDLEKIGVTEETYKKYADAYSAFLFENKKSYKTKTTLTRVKYDLTKDPSEMTDAERHNLTLDIVNKVITHPKMQKVFFSPGNSDSISRAGKVISILGNKEALKKLKDSKNTDEIINFLKKGKDEELDKFIKENGVDPLSDETFIKFHQQNMMGATLIGPYAISSVGHAKLVYANVMLAEAERFSIDGHEIAKLDPREDLNGRLVSANLAEFISAAVDNAKDPKLAKMLQNPNTANIAEAACRLGIPIDILSYALAHPLVQKIFNESGSLQSLSSYLEGDNSDKMDISTYSSNEFLLAGLNYNEESNNNSIDFLTAKTLHFLVRLQKYGDELTSITLNTRQENQNGGLASTLPEALLQVVKVRQMKNNIEFFTNIDSLLKENLISSNASNKEIREMLEDRVLSQTQAGYSLGIENALKEISKFTELASDTMITLLQEVCKNSGKYIVNKKIATSLIYDRIMFNIANSKELFPGTSYGDMYDYYLKEFPKYFINKIKTNSKFNSKKLIKLINLQKGELVCSINNKNKDLTNQLTRELDMLLYGDEESVELAKHLLMYSLFKDGLRFGPTSFAKRFSTNFLKKFSGLDSAVRQLDIKNSFKNEDFLGLFYTNHFHEYGILPEEEISFSPASNSTFEVTGDPTPFRVAINSKTYEVYLLELENTEKNVSTYRYTGLSRNRYEKVYPYYSLNKKDVYSINERDSLEDSVRESSISIIRKLYKESTQVVTTEPLNGYFKEGEINMENENGKFCK